MYLNMQFYIQQCLHRATTYMMHQHGYHGNSARSLESLCNLPTHTIDRYDSSVALWKLCREGKDWWKSGPSQAKGVECELQEKVSVMDNQRKVEVFSKVGSMKNVEKHHNFSLIMASFFYGSKENVLWCLVFGFGGGLVRCWSGKVTNHTLRLLPTLGVVPISTTQSHH